MEYVLTTSGLSKRYGKFQALDDLSMHIPKGAIYGFVGRNGAGKTTLIRLICGLQEPTKGSYSIYEIDYTDKSISEHQDKSTNKESLIGDILKITLPIISSSSIKPKTLESILFDLLSPNTNTLF